MQAQAPDHILYNLTYKKTIEEIKEKLTAKLSQLRAKVEERIKRVADLRAEHGIDDSALIQLLTEAREQQNGRHGGKMSYSYHTSNASMPDGNPKMEERTIGAGVVNHLLTENDFIQTEKTAIARFELIQRNLRSYQDVEAGHVFTVDSFTLTESDLKYLGF